MPTTVKLFARARDLAGSSEIVVNIEDGATVKDLRAAITAQWPALAPLAPQLLVAIGTEYASETTQIKPGMDIACFPPVSGG